MSEKREPISGGVSTLSFWRHIEPRYRIVQFLEVACVSHSCDCCHMGLCGTVWGAVCPTLQLKTLPQNRFFLYFQNSMMGNCLMRSVFILFSLKHRQVKQEFSKGLTGPQRELQGGWLACKNKQGRRRRCGIGRERSNSVCAKTLTAGVSWGLLWMTVLKWGNFSVCSYGWQPEWSAPGCSWADHQQIYTGTHYLLISSF